MELGDTLIIIVVIGVAAGLMFIFPMSEIADLNDKEALSMVQTYIAECGNQAKMERKLTGEMLGSLEQKLNATGNTYDIEIELHIPDANPGKKTEEQLSGETSSYYKMFMPQIMDLFEQDNDGDGKKDDYIILKSGYFIIIYVKNTNTTISQMFQAVKYGITGKEPIYAQYSVAIP